MVSQIAASPVEDPLEAPAQTKPPVATEGAGAAPGAGSFPVGSLAAVRQRLRAEGLSRGAAKLISKAVRGSTHTVYRGRFREFARWCGRRGEDPTSTSVVKVANFLAHLFKKGLSYSTLCGYRSAISAYHDGVDGIRMGEHPKLVKLLKGVFNCSTPRKVTAPLWNLDKVLRSLRKAPFEPLTECTLQYLSYKVAFLLCICSASRCSDLARFAYKEPYLRWVNKDMGVRLTPKFLKKQCRPGHMLQTTFIPQFEANRLLDPVRAL